MNEGSTTKTTAILAEFEQLARCNIILAANCDIETQEHGVYFFRQIGSITGDCGVVGAAVKGVPPESSPMTKVYVGFPSLKHCYGFGGSAYKPASI